MQARATLDLRYADLFRQLKLAPAQLEKLKALLVERDTARSNVAAVATASGLNPQDNSSEIQKLVRQTQEEIEATIAQTLGPDAYSTYQNFQQTGTQRYTVKQLEQSLSYTDTPPEFGAKRSVSQSASPHLRRAPRRIRWRSHQRVEPNHHRQCDYSSGRYSLSRSIGSPARN
jgi:hypothetical protein